MSFLTRSQSADPSTPSSGKNVDYVDSTNRRPTSLDDKGVKNVLVKTNLTNFLRNSGMWFAQRQAPGSLTTYSNTTGRSIAGADGWGVTNENLSIQYIRTDTSGSPETGLQARFYGTFSKITNTGKLVISQVIEGTKTCSLRGRTVRFQVWLKASSAKTIKIAVIQLSSAGTIDSFPATFISAFGANGVDPTLGTNLAYLAPKTGVTPDNATAGASAASCSVTTSWQRFGVVVDVPSNAKNLAVLVWSDTQFAAADSFSMSQASLTDGYELQDWSPQDYATEHQMVQRFYYKTFNVDQNPTTAVGLNTGEFKFMMTVAAAAFAGVGFRFPMSMRAAPTTLTLYNPSAANAQIRDVTDGVDCTGSTVTANGEQGCWLNATGGAGSAAGEHMAVHLSADAEL